MIPARAAVVGRPHYVYRHYDQADRLLYVGCTSLPGKRMSGHKQSPWWPQVARVELSDPMPYVDAFHAEQQAILDERPAHNRMRPDTRSPRELKQSLAIHLAIPLDVERLHDEKAKAS